MSDVDPFYRSPAWLRARMVVLNRYGGRCMACGKTAVDGVQINVDHIKPRKTHRHLELHLDNLQVLCELCNAGKGNSETIGSFRHAFDVAHDIALALHADWIAEYDAEELRIRGLLHFDDWVAV